MQPMRPHVRTALKRAHPGLADDTINRVEELLALRAQLHPVRHADRIAELDRERVTLIETKMPHHAAVVQALRGRPDVDTPTKTIKSLKTSRAAKKGRGGSPSKAKTPAPGASRRITTRRAGGRRRPPGSRP